MKRSILFLCFFLVSMTLSFAQNDVRLSIQHMLGDQEFEMQMGVKNNIGDDFNVTRLEYYLSGFKVVHDGGQETAFPNYYILANAENELSEVIGSGDITNVEAIKFSIGVDPGVNNGDPALWPSGHPLAPKFPSMHWGWASGYRFIAIEGNGGASYNQLYQLHGLGNENYFEATVPVQAQASNGEVHIDLVADYIKVLENISVKSGVIVHGFDMEARQALVNMSTIVFEEAATTSTKDLQADLGAQAYPNPTVDGFIQVSWTTQEKVNEVRVTDAFGRTVQTSNPVSNQCQLEFPTTGQYWLSVILEDGRYQRISLVRQ